MTSFAYTHYTNMKCWCLTMHKKHLSIIPVILGSQCTSQIQPQLLSTAAMYARILIFCNWNRTAALVEAMCARGQPWEWVGTTSAGTTQNSPWNLNYVESFLPNKYVSHWKWVKGSNPVPVSCPQNLRENRSAPKCLYWAWFSPVKLYAPETWQSLVLAPSSHKLGAKAFSV